IALTSPTLGVIQFGGAPFPYYNPAWLTNATVQGRFGQTFPDGDAYGDLPARDGRQPITAITDGTSNTLMVSEVITGQGGNDYRGFTWWGGAAGFTGWNTPNSGTDVMEGAGCNV